MLDVSQLPVLEQEKGKQRFLFKTNVKTGKFIISHKEDEEWVNTEVPDGRYLYLWLTDCTTVWVNDKGETQTLTQKKFESEEREPAFRLTFEDQDNIYSFITAFSKKYLARFINQLLAGDLTKRFKFYFWHPEPSRHVLCLQQEIDGRMQNLKGKYDKSEFPKARQVMTIDKEGKDVPFIQNGKPVLDNQELFDYIKTQLVEELQQTLQEINPEDRDIDFANFRAGQESVKIEPVSIPTPRDEDYMPEEDEFSLVGSDGVVISPF